MLFFPKTHRNIISDHLRVLSTTVMREDCEGPDCSGMDNISFWEKEGNCHGAPCTERGDAEINFQII